MTVSLFNRKYVVTVDTIQFSDLDVRFDIKKSLLATPNTVTLNIYNLNETHRAALEQLKVATVQIEAGYVEAGTSVLFIGDLRVASSGVHQGSDWITTLSAGEGEKAVRSARVNKTFQKGATTDSVLKNLVQALGVSPGNSSQAIKQLKLGNLANSFTEGTVLCGSASREMTDLCRSMGLLWSVHNGALQIVQLKKALDGAALELDATTGMIGSPTLDNKGILKVKTLMAPNVFPGRKLVLQSDRLSGQYRIETTTHTGDTQGADWYVDIEAKRY